MKTRIAIVDDKRLLRQSLSEQLLFCPEIDVLFLAENGVDFLEQMKSLQPATRPEVVLMDIEMPEMDGIETVETAREIYPEIQFLMLTVFDEDDKIFEAIKAGAGGYLLKDEKLTNIIKAVLEMKEAGGAPMSPRIARKALALLKNTPAPAQPLPETGCILSSRELEILQATVDGLNYQQIGEKLFISPHTVRKHTANIYEKLHVSNKASAIKVALKKRWFG